MVKIKHLGSITDINGAKIEKVDCITFGAPCQDLSIAGKRKGMKHTDLGDDETTRSGLFFEAIRLIKEMREDDRNNGRAVRFLRPRYAVYENVAGAFSSNQGKDWQAVLTEIVRVVEPEAPDVPLPEKGKWPHAGELHDNMGRWSVAWRLVDAQYYGTPQRRKRVALVADFSGGGAADILFEQYLGDESEPEIQSQPKGLSRDSEQSGTQRKDSAETVGNSLEKTSEGGSISFQERAGKPGGGKGILIQNEHTGALSTLNNQSVFGISSFESNAMKSSNPNSGIYEADTARTLDNNGGSPDCHQGGMAVVYDASRRHDYQPFGDVSETVQAQYGTGGNNQPIVLEGNGARASHKGDGWKESETMYTLNTVEQHAVCHADGGCESRDVSPTLVGDHQNRITDLTAITYQDTTGSLCASRYDKLGTQEALNDMYVVGETWDGSQIAPTLTANSDNQRMPDKSNFNGVLDYSAPSEATLSHGGFMTDADESGISSTLQATDYKDPQVVCSYGLDRSSFNQGKNAQFGFCIDEEKIGAQVAKEPGAVCSVDCRNGTEDEVNGSLQASADHNNNSNNVCRTNASVRRLTPLECSRLQGFPDKWLDIGDWIDSKGKLHKDADSPKYKALGNSIAIPFWFWLMRRISAQYTRRATLGSLFDGIGGFPLCWEMCNGKGSARWASEIEEFPIAVTKVRFPEPNSEL